MSWVLKATCAFHLFTQLGLTKTNFYSDSLVSRNNNTRNPILFVDNKFNCFEALLSGFVISIADANELIAIFFQ